mmetsp:Transcript_45575/g.126478  ORF Transcript_45575/g.126478 Transcript_45575/m.126478 type:complete len:312 (+) Transcript_45575:671-1606(+)
MRRSRFACPGNSERLQQRLWRLRELRAVPIGAKLSGRSAQPQRPRLTDLRPKTAWNSARASLLLRPRRPTHGPMRRRSALRLPKPLRLKRGPRRPKRKRCVRALCGCATSCSLRAQRDAQSWRVKSGALQRHGGRHSTSSASPTGVAAQRVPTPRLRSWKWAPQRCLRSPRTSTWIVRAPNSPRSAAQLFRQRSRRADSKRKRRSHSRPCVQIQLGRRRINQQPGGRKPIASSGPSRSRQWAEFLMKGSPRRMLPQSRLEQSRAVLWGSRRMSRQLHSRRMAFSSCTSLPSGHARRRRCGAHQAVPACRIG